MPRKSPPHLVPLTPHPSRLTAYCGFVQDLDRIAVGVGEVERVAAVPMALRGVHDSRPAPFNLREHPVHRFRRLHDEPKMVQKLAASTPVLSELPGWDLVQRQIVAPRAEVQIVLIWLPDHPHPEEP